ncbi:unnamed protein product [Arabidopsis halleri]
MYTFDSDETQNGEENQTNVHFEEHLDNASAPMHTQGREQGKWVVNVISSDGTLTQERLTAQDIWGMENRRVVLEFGPYNQPEDGSGGIFGTWLGMFSNDVNKFPINYVDWRKVPIWRKDEAWEYIQSKFYFDASNEKIKKFVMKSLSQKCKGVKTRLWNTYRRNTREEAIEVRPEFIPKEQWQDFVHLQFREKAKTLREQNVKSRSHYKTPHTLGKKSISRKSKEIFLKTGKRPSRGEIFLCTRQKANGSFVNAEATTIALLVEGTSG